MALALGMRQGEVLGSRYCVTPGPRAGRDGGHGLATTRMAARYQHMTDPIRADIAKRVGGLIWKPAELPPADPAGEQEGGSEAA